MKFIINNIEIKTVLKNAVIRGSFAVVSRCAIFSYIYNPNASNFQNYKAKIGYSVLIKDDNGKNIFQGIITNIDYKTDSKFVTIYAKDRLFMLANTKIKGRFKDTFLSIMRSFVSKFSFANKIFEFLKEEINIVSLGKFTKYDILKFAVSKIFKDEFKIYLDGDSNLKVAVAAVSENKGEFELGKNILSSVFSSRFNKNTGRIIAFGDNNVVTGSLIKIIDKTGKNSGYFLVKEDVHTFGDSHLMELELEERRFK